MKLETRRIGPQGRIIDIDYSKGMLEQARGLVRREWKNIDLVHDDAATLQSRHARRCGHLCVDHGYRSPHGHMIYAAVAVDLTSDGLMIG